MKRLSFVLSAVAAGAALSINAQAIAGELHVWTSDASGFNTNSVWYDDGREVVVVDTQFTPTIAEKMVADIRKATKSPITLLVVTHPNPDKFNALSVFHRLGADSIASQATADAMPGVDAYKRHFWTKVAAAFTDETYPRAEPVKRTFTGQKTITLKSGETISLIELARPGISSTQTVVRFDATGDLAVGDLVANNTHAWLEGGIVGGKPKPDIAGWKADLRQLAALSTGKVYPGRGPAEPVGAATEAQITYLDRADAVVTAYVRRLGARAEAEFAEPIRAKAHYAALQAELTKAFPDYAMPDLIAYSVHGLVAQKLEAQ